MKVAVWASNTNGEYGSYLVLQNDGNLVIYGGFESLLNTRSKYEIGISGIK